MTDKTLTLKLTEQTDSRTTEVTDAKKIEKIDDVDTALQDIESDVIFGELKKELKTLAEAHETESLEVLIQKLKEKQTNIFATVLSKRYITLADGTKREYLRFEKTVGTTLHTLAFDVTKVKKTVEEEFLKKFMKKGEEVFNTALVDAKKARVDKETDATKKQAIENETAKKVELAYTTTIEHDTTSSTTQGFLSKLFGPFIKMWKGELSPLDRVQNLIGTKKPEQFQKELAGAKEEAKSWRNTISSRGGTMKGWFS